MSTWIIISWVLVALLTAVNVFVFLKLKGASEQMLKMAFPGARDMNDALGKMQQMMGGMRGPTGGPMGGKGPRGPQGAKGNDAQLKAAMEMLQNMNKGKR